MSQPITIPYQPLDPDPEPEATVLVNIAPVPDLSFEEIPASVSPAVAEHVTAARTKGLAQFNAASGAVGHVRQNAVALLTGGVPKELTDALASPDPEVRRVFTKHYHQTMARNVEATYKALDDSLAKAEEEHQAALLDLPSRRVRTQDLGYVNANLLSWDVIPARYLVPILRRELITEPVREGHFGRTLAALPALRALIEKPNSGKDTPEMHAVLREMEIASRGPDYYQHMTALMAARQTRVKLESLARDVVATNGRLERVPGIAAQTRVWNRTVETRLAGYYHEFAGMDKYVQAAAA